MELTNYSDEIFDHLFYALLWPFLVKWTLSKDSFCWYFQVTECTKLTLAPTYKLVNAIVDIWENVSKTWIMTTPDERPLLALTWLNLFSHSIIRCWMYIGKYKCEISMCSFTKWVIILVINSRYQNNTDRTRYSVIRYYRFVGISTQNLKRSVCVCTLACDLL